MNEIITRGRSVFFWCLVVASSAWMASRMSYILQGVDISWLQAPIFLLFVSCFTWICVPFWIAVAGFFVICFRLNPFVLERRLPLRPRGKELEKRHAVVMPVYNESSALVFGAMAAMYDELKDLTELAASEHFDFFVLSDTRDADLVAHESSLCKMLRGEGRHNFYYRHRQNNVSRKAGNIEDFVERWGANYESMIVLDADSVMSGKVIVELASLLEANPQAALLQTSPKVIFAKTLFGRLIQFTSRLYGTLFSYGAAFWHGSNSNYWGHNAIIRIEPFRRHCGLGELPGRAPFGGQILSHDFVEAALLHSAGWGVYLIPWLAESFEQVPPTPLEYLQRDKRWSQGNIQHLKLLFRPELLVSSRTFFVLGALAYISSPLWLLLLLSSSLDAILEALLVHEYFPSEHQLFPTWPISRGEDALYLFLLTVLVLFGPKVGALFLNLKSRISRLSFGSVSNILFSALAETLFFTLFAPTMMMFHSWFVVNTLLGRTVTWDVQQRDSLGLSFPLALSRSGWIGLVGLSWAITLGLISPTELVWIAPILLGMLLSPILIWAVSSPYLGELSKRYGLLLVPEEISPPGILAKVHSNQLRLQDLNFAAVVVEDYTPMELRAEMPTNPLFVN